MVKNGYKCRGYVIALEYRKKGYKMKKVNELVNVEFCEICDNYTPEIWIDEAGENGCQICFDAYGLEF